MDAFAEAAASTSESPGGESMLRVVVEGCCHGELDQIYASIGRLEQAGGKKVDLLICCGDFQAVRNKEDLATMNVPSKYLTMASFHRYYSGEAVAPVLTLFIGGNHEASNHLQELYYGGWVAPNIYYLGCSGVVRVGGVRIAGLSGIYNGRHYKRGHYEAPPYSSDSIRSVYHVREFEVFKLAQLREARGQGQVQGQGQGPLLDVMLSHDWPRGIYHHGDMQRLLRAKPFFRQECETNTLGSPPAEFLLEQLKPAFWFSGHLHCKFAALVRHPGNGPDGDAKTTRFLALDKCLPNRDFLQLVEIPRPAQERGKAVRLEHDVEWLAIVKATHDLLSRAEREAPLPSEVRLVTEDDKAWVRARLEAACKARGQDPATQALEIPAAAFERTAPVFNPNAPRPPVGGSLTLRGSPQTDALLALLELGHRVTIPYQPAVVQEEQAPPAAGEGAPLFYLDHGDNGAPSVSLGASGSSGDPNAIDIDLAGEEGGGEADGNGGENDGEQEGGEEGGDTIVYVGEPAAAAGVAAAVAAAAGGTSGPPKGRPKLVLPPPSSSSS